MTPFCLLLFAHPTVTLTAKNMPAADALEAIHKQTGVRAVLGLPASTVTLDLREASPWRALDAVAAQLNARLEPYRDSIKLLPFRAGEVPAPTSYDGPFRSRVVRVQSSRDLTSASGSTAVALEITWLPTLRPIYLDSTPHTLRVADRLGKAVPLVEESPTLVPVEGRASLTFDVSLPHFPRPAAHIGKLAGKLNAVVLGDMLTFDFDANLETLQAAPPGGTQRRLARHGVTCSVAGVTVGRDRWTVKVALDYPAGANRDFESFQAGSMVVANELRLISLDGKRSLAPSASVAEETGPRRTVVSFHFTDGPTGKRGTAGAWKLRYRAPARILDAPLSFSFDKVPLP